MSDGGKGSAPRPIVDRKKFEENWDAIFGKNTIVRSNTPEHIKRIVSPWEKGRDCGGAKPSTEDKPSE